jgi:hypothetical protein
MKDIMSDIMGIILLFYTVPSLYMLPSYKWANIRLIDVVHYAILLWGRNKIPDTLVMDDMDISTNEFLDGIIISSSEPAVMDVMLNIMLDKEKPIKRRSKGGRKSLRRISIARA